MATADLPNDPIEITELLKSPNPKDNERGYEAFLARTHWFSCNNPESLKELACKQLGVSPNKVIASRIKIIQPGLLWASQDGLEADKLNMVEAAYKHIKQKGEELPPIIVWNFFDNARIRYVVHDGHHRAYFCYRYNIKLQAVILEPLGNYEEVMSKFRYAFELAKRVIDLPVMPSPPIAIKKKKTEEKIACKDPDVQPSNLADSRNSGQYRSQVIDIQQRVAMDEIREKSKKEISDKGEIVGDKDDSTLYGVKRKRIPATVMDKRYAFHWDFIDVNQFGPDELKDFDINDIRKMFMRRNRPMVPELAYLSFLLHSRWGPDFNIERGVQRVIMELRLPLFEGEGLSYTYRKLNPAKIWASQDSLDIEILNMVREAMKYMIDENKPIPPVIVWLIKESSKYNYVCHDGHHRIYVAWEMGILIPAIILEYWIDNREDPLLPKKIPYEEINRYVIELPIRKFEGVRYTKRIRKKRPKVIEDID